MLLLRRFMAIHAFLEAIPQEGFGPVQALDGSEGAARESTPRSSRDRSRSKEYRIDSGVKPPLRERIESNGESCLKD